MTNGVALSVPASTVGRVQDPHAVDDGDEALQQMLALAAEYTTDPLKKQAIADFQLTLRPLAERSREEREALIQTCSYIMSLGRLGREIEQLAGPDARPRSPDPSADD
jgi:hypothetical protein